MDMISDLQLSVSGLHDVIEGNSVLSDHTFNEYWWSLWIHENEENINQ